jgi:hypothetical protein
MTKKDFNRVVSAHAAGVSAEICVGMILDINKKRAESRKSEGIYFDFGQFHGECQRDIPLFYKTIGREKI